MRTRLKLVFGFLRSLQLNARIECYPVYPNSRNKPPYWQFRVSEVYVSRKGVA